MAKPIAIVTASTDVRYRVPRRAGGSGVKVGRGWGFGSYMKRGYAGLTARLSFPYRITKNTDPINVSLHDVTILEPNLRRHTHSHTRRRAS